MTFDTPEERKKFIEDNLKLIYYCAKSQDPDEIQEGVIGLIKAVDRFEPERGNAFSSFAVSYIKGHIMHWRTFNKVIKPLRSSESPTRRVKYACMAEFPENYDPAQEECNVELELVELVSSWPERWQKILELTCAGYTQITIAKYLKISRMTLYKDIQKIRRAYIAENRR